MRANVLNRMRKGAGMVLACALAALLALSLPLEVAGAEVRRADIVLDQTVEQRGLAVSDCPNIDASYALLMDREGNVYFERAADEESKIASITKVMTAIVALDALDTSTTVTVSPTAASVGESSAELYEGDELTLADAIKALLLMSGNDAAQAIAETVGAARLEEEGQDASDPDACLEAFVGMMNEKAAEIGMESSSFANPHGLDDDGYEGDHHSTARDVATMVSYAMANETFRDSVDEAVDTITVERDGEEVDLEMESTDELLGVYEGACGVKTGYTSLAGYCFAGACNRGGVELYSVVLGSSSETQRFDDTTALFDWYFEHCVAYPLANSSETAEMTVGGQTSTVPVVAYVACADYVDRTVAATLSDPDATAEIFDLNGNVSQEIAFDEVAGAVHAGDKVGTAVFKQRNEVVAQYDLVACEDVEAPGFFEGIGIWWDRFFRGFSGAPTQAESTILNDTPLVVDKTAAGA